MYGIDVAGSLISSFCYFQDENKINTKFHFGGTSNDGNIERHFIAGFVTVRR